MSPSAKVATVESFSLGEGPHWDPVRSQLLWVDINNGTVYVGVLRADDTIRVISRVHVDDTVGAVVVSEDGDWLVAGRHRLIVRRSDGSTIPFAETIHHASRFNDGKVDPYGRFVVGTLALSEATASERLSRVEADGTLSKIDDDLTLSNGLAWSADGTLLYSVDTLSRSVYRRTYDAQTGRSGPREVFLSFEEGHPDGMTIDVEDHLWVAMWGLGEVRRYSPAGQLAASIAVPAPHTSSVAFAGLELDTLVITTATQDLDEQALLDFPFSGRLFTAKPGVRGLPQPPWNGRPNPLLTERIK
ncbi:SMP-30/gluconolactonase/LRE family protein [Microbacterium sp. NPDC089698]|uniref:SMP-30/gluconolactonase/LRE family protein n=1 Tax=Microbacterium sp. NPDC089698 TaxID=3364200 RepID=UPI0037F77D71